MKLLRPLMSVLVLLVLLAACSPAAAPTAPAATAAAPAIALPETYSAQDMLGGMLTVQYPATWATQGQPEGLQVQLASQADLFTATPGTLAAGQVQMVVSALPNSLAAGAVSGGAALTPRAFLESFLAQVRQTSPNLAVNAITELTLGGYPAAQTSGTAPEGDALLLVIAREEAYLLIFGTTAPGELPAQQPLLLAIAQTADYATAAE
ncbi:MAG: hypothetical protein MUE40_14835 [Anaerolineae bacterium]|nr:hypothetical protein [Anaerolineae bacterium]